jgi:hypothetical protein
MLRRIGTKGKAKAIALLLVGVRVLLAIIQ